MIAIAAPPALLAGVAALLFILAWRQFGGAIVSMMSVNLPIIGNVIGNAVSAGLQATYLSAEHFLDGFILPVVEIIVRPIAAVENTFAAALQSAANTYLAVESIIQTRLPQVFAQATSYAHSIGDNVLAQAQSWDASVRNYALSLANNVLAQATVWVGQAETYAHSIGDNVLAQAEQWTTNLEHEVTNGLAAAQTLTLAVATTAERDIATALHNAEGYADGLAGALRTDITNTLTEAEGYADRTAQSLVGVLATDEFNAITGALGAVWPDIDSVVTDVIGVLGADDPDILSAIKSIDWTIPANLAGVASLAGVTTLTLGRYLRDCGIPNCKNLSGFGNVLQDIIGITEDATFLDFLVSLIHNPSGAFDELESEFGGVVSVGVDSARALIGF